MKQVEAKDSDFSPCGNARLKTDRLPGFDLPFRRYWLALVAVFAACILISGGLRADTAAFDLVGPKLEVRVHRESVVLPISEVPNLQAGDRLWVHPDLPDDQSVHYLMVIAFLRGATNPPPDSWFTPIETWNRPVREEGAYITVPEGAEEALVMLAPETGGAFSTLRRAVRGKPGAFVRAAQDLEQASFDRARLEKYLEAVRESAASNPEQLKTRTTLLAHSLNIRLDQQCFDKPTAQQAPCLTQNTDQLVLDDARSQTMVATLTSGTSTDLMSQLSSTPTARSGYYSPYVGAIVDLAKILGATHTAQYQYIPALASPKQDEMNLRLNNPPSFRNPKSVLVIGLPPVHPTPLPTLRAENPTQVLCASKERLVLPVDNDPLAFATEMGHNFVLRVGTKNGSVDLPAEPDAANGGFVVKTEALQDAVTNNEELSGVLRGSWGFQTYEGPRFRLRTSHPVQWIVASKDASALIIGREDTLHLQGGDSCCVQEVSLVDQQGKHLEAHWKITKVDELEVQVPLQGAPAGSLTMMVKKFGLREADEIHLHTYAEAGRLDGFTIHAGDSEGVLKGTRLDQVLELEAGPLRFKPTALSRANQHDELTLTSEEPIASALLQPDQAITVQVTLKDGRVLDLRSSVAARRPNVSVISKSVQYDDTLPPSLVRLSDPEELPQEARLNFFVKSQVPDAFPPTEKIEVATADDSFHVLLSFKEGNLTLQDSKTVFAVLDPMRLLGPSAFGPLKFRPVTADGVEGDWQPLIELVRVPALKGVRCASLRERQCTLSGDKLFLIDQVSSDPDFANAVTVPDGFAETTLLIPPPKGKTLYLKLRDNPISIDTAVVPMLSNAP
ncbi:MAG: hypothetical protein WCB53_05865 [Terriglobales bacterium]